MRITNNIMINNSLTNININKTLTDKLNTQLSSEKKIQRPSEDPIVAIRALRLRATYSEIGQYLDKNIPDARSWLELTEDSLDSVTSIMKDIIYDCNQGVNDYYDSSNRDNLIQTLKKYRDQVYSDANADYAGRTIFTGYKTDSTMTFTSDEPDTKYSIKESFDFNNIETVKKLTGSVDTSKVETTLTSSVQNIDVKRVRIAYDSLATTGIAFSAMPDLLDDVQFVTKSLAANGDSVYQPDENEIVFIPETGEIVFGSGAYDSIKECSDFSITYEKDGFDKGELRPEHYFDCKNITSSNPEEQITYTAQDQPINYTINFNQTLQVNTLGKDVFTHAMTRDIDELTEAVQAVSDIETKLSNLNTMLSDASTDSEKAKIQTMIDAANMEYDYAKSNMGDAFSKGITKFTKHQEKITLATADIGARETRLTLNETRLKSQKLSVEDLKSKNEEVNVAEIAIQFKAASEVYDASLAAAAKVVKNSLLDYI